MGWDICDVRFVVLDLEAGLQKGWAGGVLDRQYTNFYAGPSWESEVLNGDCSLSECWTDGRI